MTSPKKPRVLIFSLAYTPFIGGAEVAIKEITDRLPGYQFDMLTVNLSGREAPEEYLGGIRVYRLGRGRWSKYLFPFSALKWARFLHQKNAYDLSWAMMANQAGLATLFFKWFSGVPYVLTLQEGDSDWAIWWRTFLIRPLYRLIYKSATRIQAISHFLADRATQFAPGVPVTVVANGVADHFFASDAEVRDPRLVVTASRLVHKNGVDTLIEALTFLPSSIKLAIAGSGADESKLRRLVERCELTERVQFLGHVADADLAQVLKQAAVFVRPSRSEGLGNAFLEAMAAGVPVVGTLVGGIPDFLHPGVTGFSARVNDSRDVADQVAYILDVRNGETVTRIVKTAQTVVQESYRWDRIAQAMAGIFDIAIRASAQTSLTLATPLYPPEIGGPATYAVLLEQELPKQGIQVTTVKFSDVRHFPKLFRHLAYMFKVWRTARTSAVILAQDTVSVGLPTLIAAKILGRKFLVRVPGDYAWEQSVQRFGVTASIDDFQTKRYGFRVEFLRWIQKVVVRSADRVITPSHYFNRLVSGWLARPEVESLKVQTIYNGVDVRDLPPMAERRRTIVSVGRLVPWKGFDVLIECLLELPGWRLEIIGDGPDRARLEAVVRRWNLEDRVTLLGQVPRAQVLERLARGEVFVLNTSFESFSFQVVEAMSVGIPVIATNIGNLPEIITHGREGFLVTPGDKQAIVTHINQMAEDHNLRNSLVAAARVKAQNFSIERTVAQVVDLIHTLHV